MTRSDNAMLNTFLMSNMAPQHCAFNRGPWQVLEGRIRSWVRSRGEAWIITGAIFDRDTVPGRDPDGRAWRMQSRDKKRRVAIPSAFYKIVLAGDPQTQELQAIAVLLPNIDKKIPRRELPGYLTAHLVSIDVIETLTGHRFFSKLAAGDRATENRLTTIAAPALWAGGEVWPGPLDFKCKADYPER